MKTSELRVGNYIQVLEENIATPLTGVMTVRYAIINSIDEDSLRRIESDEYKPVLINDIWVSKLQAKLPFNDDKLIIGNLHFRRTEIGLIHCDKEFNPSKGEKLFSYVHQVQNLYNDLNNQQLEIL